MMITERLIIHYVGRFLATIVLVAIAAAIVESYVDSGNPLHPGNWLGSAIMMSLIFVGIAPLMGGKKPWRLPVAIASIFPMSYLVDKTRWGWWVALGVLGIAGTVSFMQQRRRKRETTV